MNEWVEFNAPPRYNIGHFGGGVVTLVKFRLKTIVLYVISNYICPIYETIKLFESLHIINSRNTKLGLETFRKQEQQQHSRKDENRKVLVRLNKLKHSGANSMQDKKQENGGSHDLVINFQGGTKN